MLTNLEPNHDIINPYIIPHIPENIDTYSLLLDNRVLLKRYVIKTIADQVIICQYVYIPIPSIMFERITLPNAINIALDIGIVKADIITITVVNWMFGNTAITTLDENDIQIIIATNDMSRDFIPSSPLLIILYHRISFMSMKKG